MNRQEGDTLMDRLKRAAGRILPVVAVAMGVYHLLYTQILLQDPDGHIITHVGLALVVCILSMLIKADRSRVWSLNLILLVATLAVTGYLLYYLDEILEFRTAIPAPLDLIAGVIIILVLLAANWLVFGATFSIISMVAIAYLICGRFLPSPFTVPAVGYQRLLMWLSVQLGTGEGVYGSITNLSAVYLFLFIFFGGLLNAFGGTRFIIGLGRWIGSKLPAGPAMVALVGSSLLGTVTGSTVANVTITGTFTIPMMKRSGYTPEQAGAIEAVASNGGQIMPPVMGATAFIMAGFAGIPYITIVVAAIVPALFYFFCIFLYIHLTAQKLRLEPYLEKVSGKQLLLDSPIFILPIGILVVLLAKGYSLPFVAFWSVLAIIVTGLISSIRKEARLNARQLLQQVTASVVSGSQIAIICALIGVVATAIKVSGLGIKLPLVISDISHGILLLALFVAMISSILLGMGVPTAAAYLLVAIGAIPALLEMGVPLLSAHLFCFIFAAFSHITPPVAIGALVASRMAEANYWGTNWEAIKAAFVAFLLPYFIVYVPVIILRPTGGPLFSVALIIAMLLLVISLQVGVSNYCLTALRLVERVLFTAVSLSCCIFIFGRYQHFFALAGVLFTVLMIRHYFIWRHARRSAAA
jgi:TRAP transporter 4TM/12TM fusion protein